MAYDLRTALHDYTRDPEVGPTGVDAASVSTQVHRRRMVRGVTTGLSAAAAVVVLAAVAYGLTGLPTDPVPEPPAQTSPTAAEPSSTPSRTPRTTPTPSATATSEASTPTPPRTTPPAVEPELPETLVFRTGARVGDLPSNAPEGDVVAYLTEYLSVQPETTDPEYACPTSGRPGRNLHWPGTGVGIRVRTTDAEGNPVDPYVAAWTLTEPSGDLGLATDAGLTAGASRGRVLDLYPAATGGEDDHGGGSVSWWYSVTDDGGDLLVVGGDGDSIHRIESGYGCGE